MLLVKIMLCNRLHCQIFVELKHISYKIGVEKKKIIRGYSVDCTQPLLRGLPQPAQRILYEMCFNCKDVWQ